MTGGSRPASESSQEVSESSRHPSGSSQRAESVKISDIADKPTGSVGAHKKGPGRCNPPKLGQDCPPGVGPPMDDGPDERDLYDNFTGPVVPGVPGKSKYDRSMNRYKDMCKKRRKDNDPRRPVPPPEMYAEFKMAFERNPDYDLALEHVFIKMRQEYAPPPPVMDSPERRVLLRGRRDGPRQSSGQGRHQTVEVDSRTPNTRVIYDLPRPARELPRNEVSVTEPTPADLPTSSVSVGEEQAMEDDGNSTLATPERPPSAIGGRNPQNAATQGGSVNSLLQTLQGAGTLPARTLRKKAERHILDGEASENGFQALLDMDRTVLDVDRLTQDELLEHQLTLVEVITNYDRTVGPFNEARGRVYGRYLQVCLRWETEVNNRIQESEALQLRKDKETKEAIRRAETAEKALAKAKADESAFQTVIRTTSDNLAKQEATERRLRDRLRKMEAASAVTSEQLVTARQELHKARTQEKESPKASVSDVQKTQSVDTAKTTPVASPSTPSVPVSIKVVKPATPVTPVSTRESAPTTPILTPAQKARKEEFDKLFVTPDFQERMNLMMREQFLSALPPLSPATDPDHPGPVHMPAPVRQQPATANDQEMKEEDKDVPMSGMEFPKRN